MASENPVLLARGQWLAHSGPRKRIFERREDALQWLRDHGEAVVIPLKR